MLPIAELFRDQKMSVLHHSLLFISVLLLLTNIAEHNTVQARFILAHRKVYPGSSLSLTNEHGADGPSADEENFYYPGSRPLHYLKKRGPEIFIPYMEV